MEYTEGVRFDSLGLSPEKIPPAASAIEAQPSGILPFQRENCCIDIAFVGIQLPRNFAQLHFYAIIREQSMAPEPLRTGTGSNVVGVGFRVRHSVQILLNCHGDKF